MSEFQCYLITLYLVSSGVHTLTRVALETKEDYTYWQEPDVREKLLAELPLHVRMDGVVVEVMPIYDIIPRQKESR